MQTNLLHHNSEPKRSISTLFSTVGGANLLNGSVISTPDYEEELFVPPPPTMAPPPPPGTFIPPPPEFMCGVDDPDLQHLRPPPMLAPKPPSALPSMEEEDFSFLKPPQMAPPRPPSICSSGSASTLSASSLPSDLVPEHPKFAAPQPPSERQAKMKMPPPKPIRISSIATCDSPPQTPAPPPPAQKPTPSTFNPQNTAKLYDIPKASILSRCEDRNPAPMQLLFVEDSRSVKSNPVPAQFDGKTPKLAPPLKPISKEGKKHDLNISQGSPSPRPELKKELTSESVGPDRPLQTQQASPQRQKGTNSLAISSKDQPKGSLSPTGKFSPLLNRKLRNLKGSEIGASREASAASPLALLLAAKERDKHRSNQYSNDLADSHPAANVHLSDQRPNSSTVKPRSSFSFLTSQSVTEERSKSAAALETAQTPTIPQKPRPAPVKDHMQSSSMNGMAEPLSATNLATQQRIPEDDHKDDGEQLSVPLLPPPPEFGDTDYMTEPPPNLPPPDPPSKTPQITPPSLKPKPPQAPVLPPLQTKVKPKPPVQTNLTKSPPPAPAPLSPSHATLLSILQKKMLEMDHKMTPVKEGESSLDDWNTPLSDEDNGPTIPKVTPQSKKNPGVNKAALDLRELEEKVSTSAVR